ncbi:hypothetical protein POSPLADRAFT_1129030 [Postia placenta MAD-698-R-SB12]|uniref:Ketoreductase (KR) domain-containing protein n=1 Tax=Postia placenta MAD-698-R-SB12 TaxID=670580 RepID=A0A1X6NE94_9APHY|nr:hypothetical protein POSPLADRAFT_1129030 [Postia placenta MAD-698-R-SB12]OSX66914.1 hypothetical protein POSPLADRAFT_1129030 [Postia placenta MAD-698-R-SB12]
MPSYAVIGGSRGIGLEFVRQLSSNPENTVFVTVRNRNSSTYLAELVAQSGHQNIHVLEADVVDHRALKAAAEEVVKATGGSLDVLINNAARTEAHNAFKGLLDYEDEDASDAEFLESFKINVLGFVHSVNTFLPLLRKGSAKKIVLIGSQGGERDFVWEARMPNMTAYSTTKAAAHMVMAKYAVLLEKEGFVVTSLCPGIVDVTTTASSECGSFTLAHIRGRIELIANAVLLDKQIWKKEVEAQQADFRKAVPDFKFEPQSPEGSVTTLLRTIAALDSSECGKFLSHGEQVAAQNQGKS